MSIHAKILVDIAEFDRLKAIEKAYKELKEEKHKSKAHLFCPFAQFPQATLYACFFLRTVL